MSKKIVIGCLWPELGKKVNAVFDPSEAMLRVSDPEENLEVAAYGASDIDAATDTLVAKGVMRDQIEWVGWAPTDFAQGQPADGDLDSIPTGAGGGDGGGEGSGEGAGGGDGGGDGGSGE